MQSSFIARSIVLCFALTGLASEAWAADPPAGAADEASKAAEPPSEEAKQAARTAFGDGQKAYAAGDFAAAEVGFSKANSEVPSVTALYWVAMSQDKAGKAREAYASFDEFFSHAEHESLGEEKVAAARARFEALGALPGVVSVNVAPETAQLSVDGAAQTGSSPFRLELAPGEHTLEVSAAGYVTAQKQLTVKPSSEMSETVQLEAEPPPPAPPPPPAEAAAPAPPPPPPSKAPAYVTLGIAGASAIVGGIFGFKALSAKSDFNDNPTASNADDVERNALIADMAFGITVTLGITGVVLLTSDDPTEAGATANTREAAQKRVAKQRRLDVAPSVSKSGGGAAARLLF
jgi:hypothetical protein